MRSGLSGATTAASALISAGALIAAHATMDFDVTRISISDMVHGDVGWLITVTIAAAATAQMALAVGVWHRLNTRWAAAALLLAGVATAVASVFEDPLPGANGSGSVHETAIAVASAALLVALARLWQRLRDRPHWTALARASLAVAVILVVSWALRIWITPGGIAERAYVAVLLVWLMSMGAALMCDPRALTPTRRSGRAAGEAVR